MNDRDRLAALEDILIRLCLAYIVGIAVLFVLDWLR